MKQLELNKDYGDIFGLDKKKGQEMIYLGENSWKGVQKNTDGSIKREMVIESAAQTKNALDYINQPSVIAGNLV